MQKTKSYKLGKNKYSQKRWRLFKTCKRAVYSLFIILGLMFFSLTAEFWANNRPLILSYENKIYFPVIKNYSPSDLGLPDSAVTIHYKELDLTNKGWALWPPIPWDPYESNKNVSSYPSAPSPVNWMGTDDRGRDVFSRMIYGFRYSLSFAILVWLGAFALGTLLGSFMGFKGGRVDLIGQRLLEVFQSLPYLLLLITLIALLGANFYLLVLFSVIFGWMNISIYMRAEFLKLRKMEFVESMRAAGASSSRLIFKHILPNALTPLITFSPFRLALGILSLAILDYLGFGLPPPTPSWGEMLAQAEQHFTIGWWLAFFPSMFLLISLICLNFIGEGVRLAFDPKAREQNS